MLHGVGRDAFDLFTVNVGTLLTPDWGR